MSQTKAGTLVSGIIVHDWLEIMAQDDNFKGNPVNVRVSCMHYKIIPRPSYNDSNQPDFMTNFFCHKFSHSYIVCYWRWGSAWPVFTMNVKAKTKDLWQCCIPMSCVAEGFKVKWELLLGIFSSAVYRLARWNGWLHRGHLFSHIKLCLWNLHHCDNNKNSGNWILFCNPIFLVWLIFGWLALYTSRWIAIGKKIDI